VHGNRESALGNSFTRPKAQEALRPPGEVILGSRDIGSYFQRHHYWMEDVADVGDISRRPNVGTKRA
jgi:hypothetical protein